MQKCAETSRRACTGKPRVMVSFLVVAILTFVLSVSFLVGVEVLAMPVGVRDGMVVGKFGTELDRTVSETAQYTGFPLKFRERLVLTSAQKERCARKMAERFRNMDGRLVDVDEVFGMLEKDIRTSGFTDRDRAIWNCSSDTFRNNLRACLALRNSQLQVARTQKFYHVLVTVSWAGLFVSGVVMISCITGLYRRYVSSWRFMYWIGTALLFAGIIVLAGALCCSLGNAAAGIGDYVDIQSAVFSTVTVTWIRMLWLFAALLVIPGFSIYLAARLKLEVLLNQYRFDR